jgi:hypothetical protein
MKAMINKYKYGEKNALGVDCYYNESNPFYKNTNRS